jgi:hypothetical protein
MQTTIDREKRKKIRQEIFNNISTIVTTIDDLERATAELKNHLRMHDRFFFQHMASMVNDESYGTSEDLEELHKDTLLMITRLGQARSHIQAAGTLTHVYDYSTNTIFEDFASAEAESL